MDAHERKTKQKKFCALILYTCKDLKWMNCFMRPSMN